MKKLLVVVLALGAAAYMWKEHARSKEWKKQARNPVYLEFRITAESGPRSIEGVIIAKTLDQADCEKGSGMIKEVFELHGNDPAGAKVNIKSSECKLELSARNAQLFDNEPNVLTYLSMARGTDEEREIRMIYWGVSLEESDYVCKYVPQLQKRMKGEVKCIRGLRS